jgi:hypothetical protein
MCAESNGRQIEHLRNGKILIYIVINFFFYLLLVFVSIGISIIAMQFVIKA